MKDEFIKAMSKSAKPGLEECRKTIKQLLELPDSERIPEKIIASVDGIPLLEGTYGQQGGQYALKIERFIAPDVDETALPRS